MPEMCRGQSLLCGFRLFELRLLEQQVRGSPQLSSFCSSQCFSEWRAQCSTKFWADCESKPCAKRRAKSSTQWCTHEFTFKRSECSTLWFAECSPERGP